ncbi:MAG TPA: hypothetical protein PLY91_09160 [Methanoregulaceae archaeon]|nr:hypothetical protein [Methanoregulaceae archaeon]
MDRDRHGLFQADAGEDGALRDPPVRGPPKHFSPASDPDACREPPGDVVPRASG